MKEYSTYNTGNGKYYFHNDLYEQEQFIESHENPNKLIVPNILYGDGAGTNGNFSRIAYGDIDNLKISTFKTDLTNNETEYLAFILCALIANKHDIIRTDSRLVMQQLKKNWKTEQPNLIGLMLCGSELLKSKELVVDWIPRAFNQAGILLDKNKDLFVR